MRYDLIIANGRLFDGTGGDSFIADIAIKDGKVARISTEALDAEAEQTIDATGKWVTPGFIDLHTHYDAEMIVAPSLGESVRHGVTTCFVGSCSISMIFSEPEDASDIFTRVESIPREHVLPILHERKTWHDARGYVDFLRQQPFGANIASYVGHSDLRTAVLGLGRAVDGKTRPTADEMARMEQLLQEGIDAGLLGMSSMTNPWDKVDGDRYRSSALPSVYAHWREYRRLHRLLRRNGAILQSAPNLNTKINALFFLFTSAGLWFRRTLRTTLITLMDPKADPWLSRLAAAGANFFNRVFGADFRWQALPSPFKVYSDGIDFIVFEEFPAGEMALHLQEDLQRNELFSAPSYREQFKKDYRKRFGGRVWHRDFGDAWVVECPDDSVVGKSISQIASERGEHEVDTFLDLIIDYGRKLRWRTVIANHRQDVVRRNVNEPCALIGFSDAGAHLRNMAFYNFPLHMLQMSLTADPALTPERAVWRCTGEIAEWFNIDAGTIAEGKRADITLIDPQALEQADLEAYAEAPFEELGGLMRVVNRNDDVVLATIINGRVAWDGKAFHPDLGRKQGFGTFLPRGGARA
ncbi:MAG: amidohydrolase family protein [Alcanivoracaceae bacterium]|nr:amidohydrolase family protein [Alcanivoracaceae bacterium]